MEEKIFKCKDLHPGTDCTFEAKGTHEQVLSDAVIHEMEEHAESDGNIAGRIEEIIQDLRPTPEETGIT